MWIKYSVGIELGCRGIDGFTAFLRVMYKGGGNFSFWLGHEECEEFGRGPSLVGGCGWCPFSYFHLRVIRLYSLGLYSSEAHIQEEAEDTTQTGKYF